MKTSLFNDTIENIRTAADIIRDGGLVAFLLKPFMDLEQTP